MSVTPIHRNLHRWLPGYARHLGRRLRSRQLEGPRHVVFAVCDHFEPMWGHASEAEARARVERWVRDYPKLAAGYRDADGRPPRHTFFVPIEDGNGEHLARLGKLVRSGLGEVEVHLHHDRDTAAELEQRLGAGLELFGSHGHLSRDRAGRRRYAFIHGNWSLANCRPDGRWCGVDAELPILFRTGCYADFTFPSAPDSTQPPIVDQIYWPTGDLERARAHERGVPAKVGKSMRDRILLIQGPLSIDVGGRFGVHVENAALSARNPASASRVASWVRRGIHVDGVPEWTFVKVHTHGAPEAQADALLGEAGRVLHEELTRHYDDGEHFVLHYVTAREMFNIALAAMEGQRGDPGDCRDYFLSAPGVSS